MRGSLTLLSAVDELQRAFKWLNNEYFEGKLERPLITILTDSTKGAYGWISKEKVWSSKDNASFREINICAEYLNREVDLIIATLLHEMCHLHNIQNGIQDVSRNETYHNARFKEIAEKCGLIVEQTQKYGWSITKPSEALSELVKKNVRAGCFKLERAKTYRDGSPRTTETDENGKEKTTSRTKQASRKYICPMCGLIIRATKDLTGKLLCVDCDAVLVEDL